MGQDEREPPFFFAKPADAIVPDGGTVAVSAADQGPASRGRAGGRAEKRRPQHPGRQGARLRLGLRRRHRPDPPRPADRLARQQAAVGDRQGVRRARRRAARCSPPAKIGHPAKGRISLKVNGKVSQDGDLAQMIWNVPEIISQAVGDGRARRRRHHHDRHARRRLPPSAGDKLECEVEGVGTLAVTIGQPAA